MALYSYGLGARDGAGAVASVLYGVAIVDVRGREPGSVTYSYGIYSHGPI